VYWTNGGRTDLGNLISLCRYHHTAVHERGYLIATCEGGGFAFYRPDGTPLPPSPSLPAPVGPLEDTHDAAITPETIIPPWYGERLDLDHAIYVCFANVRTAQEKQQHSAKLADRGARVYKPEECEELVRQYLEHAPRHTAPILVPIQA
jgi:hypothetical protein